ncbi:hypothetical protein AA309_09430 [Microvirga vignae]|uniref:Uncharacterized protein n=1 Tax=Microvirga vignae TaxID=1225564 RepID=A0A0H1REB4_9HYPH|nr:hypothetical protein [Microvirga vignae]KLK93221.1 hypothetical protein AA309_09430 [Microvirga vignae]
MLTRFDKAMEQVARAENDLKADRIVLETHAQKVRRLEELIRAKEATGDRIVIGLGAALVVSSMALPVYAAFYSDGYAYLPSVGSSISARGSHVAERLQMTAHSLITASTRESNTFDHSEDEEKPATNESDSGGAIVARYVIHRATTASALIEGPNGLWWVTPGMKIPGAGQILSIERSDTGWAVVTSETTITEGSVASLTN